MPNFSERLGLKPVRTIAQVGSMDDALRNTLWNALSSFFESTSCDEGDFTRALWWHFFKKPVDTRPIYNSGFGTSYVDVWAEVRDFYFTSDWNVVYDFVEFVLKCYPHADKLHANIGRALRAESAGYRLLNGRVVPITDEHEVGEVAAAASDAYGPVAAHLRSAIDLLTDREKPNYRNSIKESISAVEAMAKIVANEPKATLGDALKALERNGKLHRSLKEAFLKLYGYTSDAQGIRHALVDEANLSQADARYFLVVCSAFINLLKAQAV